MFNVNIHEFFQIFKDIFNTFERPKTKMIHDRTIKVPKNTSYIES